MILRVTFARKVSTLSGASARLRSGLTGAWSMKAAGVWSATFSRPFCSKQRGRLPERMSSTREDDFPLTAPDRGIIPVRHIQESAPSALPRLRQTKSTPVHRSRQGPGEAEAVVAAPVARVEAVPNRGTAVPGVAAPAPPRPTRPRRHTPGIRQTNPRRPQRPTLSTPALRTGRCSTGSGRNGGVCCHWHS